MANHDQLKAWIVTDGLTVVKAPSVDLIGRMLERATEWAPAQPALRASSLRSLLLLVGKAGSEPAASASRTRPGEIEPDDAGRNVQVKMLAGVTGTNMGECGILVRLEGY